MILADLQVLPLGRLATRWPGRPTSTAIDPPHVMDELFGMQSRAAQLQFLASRSKRPEASVAPSSRARSYHFRASAVSGTTPRAPSLASSMGSKVAASCSAP